MNNLWFCLGAAIFFAVFFAWGFRVLPREDWQFLAILPRKHLPNGTWEGQNLTFYGVFNAVAHVIAIMFFLVLTGSVGVPVAMSVLAVILLMVCCLPASHLLACWIEKKPHNFTVSGAFFTGIIFAPVAIWLSDMLTGPSLEIAFTPLYAAMSVAYAVGEGTGRLACISFGCCYGRPLSDVLKGLDRLIRPLGFVFTGKTKKIAYASGWEGVLVWPIQAFTAVIYIVTALVSTYAFLTGSYGLALVITIVVTQGWRILSETVRADFRGDGDISVYQVFSFLSIGFVLTAWTLLPTYEKNADLAAGLHVLWNVPMVFFLEAWALFIFWFTGRSRVTGSSLNIHVKEGQI
ncbi:MAG: prolipoprotein diacylglyceryl transferase [Syntrophaceae bacterium]|nr:prolipoprotein diacylglyceryl transferase [Syntrophaceae bacterium]